SVLALDSSGAACARAAAHLDANAPSGESHREVLEANAFDALRAFERDRRRFDLVVLDPPPFTRRRAAVDAALRGYKEVNLRALRCLRPGGLLAPREPGVVRGRLPGGSRGCRAPRAGRRSHEPGPGPSGAAGNPRNALPDGTRPGDAGVGG